MYIRIMGRGGNMENTEKQVIDIEQLANDLNDKAISKNQVLEKYGIKDGKMKRLLLSLIHIFIENKWLYVQSKK